MLDAPARLPSSLADDGWRARVSRTTRPGELYYYNRDRANKRLWSLEEVKAFSARSAPPGWCVKNADKALAASLQMLLALLVVFGFLEACIGAFNLVYSGGAGILPWSIALCGAISAFFGLALVGCTKEQFDEGARCFRLCCAAKAPEPRYAAAGGDVGEDEEAATPFLPQAAGVGGDTADARAAARWRKHHPRTCADGLAKCSCCGLFAYSGAAGLLSIAQLVLIPMTAVEAEWSDADGEGPPRWIASIFPFVLTWEKSVVLPPAMRDNMAHDAVRHFYLAVILTTFALHVGSCTLALLLATKLDVSLAAPEVDRDGFAARGGKGRGAGGAAGGDGGRQKKKTSKRGGKGGKSSGAGYGSFSQPLEGSAKYERIYEMYGLAEARPDVGIVPRRAGAAFAPPGLRIEIRCAKPPKARSYAVKIALAHRRRLGELSSAEIRGMLVEVRRPNSARWELATVVSSAAAPQRRARKEGGANSLAEAAGGVASGGASGVESDAPSASHAHTANASDAHAAVTKCYRVSLASPRRGGRATVVVVSSEHIRQRDSSWEWTTVSAENCIRRDAAAVRATSAGGVRAPPADHARVTCEVNVLPYLFSAAPRLVSGRAYTIAIRLEWLSEAWHTTATRKLPPIPFACTDVALLESAAIEREGRAAWPGDQQARV